MEIQLKNGFTDGAFYKFNDEGKYSVIGQCAGNKAVGTWYSYHANGNLRSIVSFCPDSAFREVSALYKKYSNFIEWDWFGASVGNAVRSENIHGMCYLYHENGRLKQRVNYKYGNPPLIDTIYNDNGKYSRLSKLISNTGDTTIRYRVTEFDTIGRMYSDAIYVNDHETSSKYYDTLGNLQSETYRPELKADLVPRDTLYLSYREYKTVRSLAGQILSEPPG